MLGLRNEDFISRYLDNAFYSIRWFITPLLSFGPFSSSFVVMVCVWPVIPCTLNLPRGIRLETLNCLSGQLHFLKLRSWSHSRNRSLIVLCVFVNPPPTIRTHNEARLNTSLSSIYVVPGLKFGSRLFFQSSLTVRKLYRDLHQRWPTVGHQQQQ